MQILIFCPAGKSFSVNETCEFLNYSFFKKLFSAILIHDTKLSSEGLGAFAEGNGSQAGPGVSPCVGLDGGSPSLGHCLLMPMDFTYLLTSFLSGCELLCRRWIVPERIHWSLVIYFDSPGGNSVVLLSPSLPDITTFMRCWQLKTRERTLQPSCKAGKAKGVYVTKSIAHPWISLFPYPWVPEPNQQPPRSVLLVSVMLFIFMCIQGISVTRHVSGSLWTGAYWSDSITWGLAHFMGLILNLYTA